MHNHGTISDEISLICTPLYTELLKYQSIIQHYSLKAININMGN